MRLGPTARQLCVKISIETVLGRIFYLAHALLVVSLSRQLLDGTTAEESA